MINVCHQNDGESIKVATYVWYYPYFVRLFNGSHHVETYLVPDENQAQTQLPNLVKKNP